MGHRWLVGRYYAVNTGKERTDQGWLDEKETWFRGDKASSVPVGQPVGTTFTEAREREKKPPPTPPYMQKKNWPPNQYR